GTCRTAITPPGSPVLLVDPAVRRPNTTARNVPARGPGRRSRARAPAGWRGRRRASRACAECGNLGPMPDSRPTKEFDGEPITAQGLHALKAELGELETAGRREIAALILTARGHGDLKENAEYHAAKEDQAHLETKIKRLRR